MVTPLNQKDFTNTLEKLKNTADRLGVKLLNVTYEEAVQHAKLILTQEDSQHGNNISAATLVNRLGIRANNSNNSGNNNASSEQKTEITRNSQSLLAILKNSKNF